MKKKFLRVLLLLTLSPSLGFTAPFYTDCEDFEPDEWLDFFGITQSITSSKVIFIDQPAAFPGSIPDSRTFHYHSGISFLQPFLAESALSVTLRC